MNVYLITWGAAAGIAAVMLLLASIPRDLGGGSGCGSGESGSVGDFGIPETRAMVPAGFQSDTDHGG